MTALSAPQMRQIDGEGFWEGLACGATSSFALAMTLSPDPFSKISLAAAWTSVVAACGQALF